METYDAQLLASTIDFHRPIALDLRVACLPSGTDETRPPKYPPIDHGVSLQQRLSAAYPLKTV